MCIIFHTWCGAFDTLTISKIPDQSDLLKWHEGCSEIVDLKSDKASEINILIIDDEEEICILLSYALKKMGFVTEYALTLSEGARKLKSLNPALVLLDINLPDGSGLSLAPQIKSINSPFVVISAYDDCREMSLETGAAAFIKKPFNLNQITSSVVGVLNQNSI